MESVFDFATLILSADETREGIVSAKRSPQWIIESKIRIREARPGLRRLQGDTLPFGTRYRGIEVGI